MPEETIETSVLVVAPVHRLEDAAAAIRHARLHFGHDSGREALAKGSMGLGQPVAGHQEDAFAAVEEIAAEVHPHRLVELAIRGAERQLVVDPRGAHDRHLVAGGFSLAAGHRAVEDDRLEVVARLLVLRNHPVRRGERGLPERTHLEDEAAARRDRNAAVGHRAEQAVLHQHLLVCLPAAVAVGVEGLRGEERAAGAGEPTGVGAGALAVAQARAQLAETSNFRA